MVKILLLSDSHGNVTNMKTAVETVKPDMIFHMGDTWNDAVKLERYYPDIPMKHVTGNCDWNGQGPSELLFELEGHRIMICHGHAYNVKMSLLSMQYAAKEKGADIVLFGHTHRIFYDRYDGLAIFNPGSVGYPGPGTPPSYGILILDQESNLLQMQTGYLN